MDMNSNITTQDLELTHHPLLGKIWGIAHAGKTQSWLLPVSAVRDWRSARIGSATLEIGDGLHIVGERLRAGVREKAGGIHKAQETNMPPYLIGLGAGHCLGLIPSIWEMGWM